MRLHSTFQDHHSRRECEQARVPVDKCDSIALPVSRVAAGRYQVVEVAVDLYENCQLLVFIALSLAVRATNWKKQHLLMVRALHQTLLKSSKADSCRPAFE